MRDKYEEKMREKREEIEMMYEKKIRKIKNKEKRKSGEDYVDVDEMRKES